MRGAVRWYCDAHVALARQLPARQDAKARIVLLLCAVGSRKKAFQLDHMILCALK